MLTSRHKKAPESFGSEVSDSRLLYLGEKWKFEKARDKDARLA